MYTITNVIRYWGQIFHRIAQKMNKFMNGQYLL